MTPEQIAQFNEMYAWYQERLTQQLSYPVDQSSISALRALTLLGKSTKLPTTTISIGAGGGSATVPIAPTGFVVIMVDGGSRTIATYD